MFAILLTQRFPPDQTNVRAKFNATVYPAIIHWLRFHERARRDDRYSSPWIQHEQVAIARKDIVALGIQGQCRHVVVVGIPAYLDFGEYRRDRRDLKDATQKLLSILNRYVAIKLPSRQYVRKFRYEYFGHHDFGTAQRLVQGACGSGP